MLVSNEVISIIGAIGLLSLAISWHRRNSSSVWLAQIGWVFVGLFFFNDASLYYAHDDLILTLFSVMALPMAGGMALWEHKADDERTRSSLVWARGAVAYAGGPYLLIAHVPLAECHRNLVCCRASCVVLTGFWRRSCRYG